MSDLDGADPTPPPGTLTISWLKRSASWISYRVFVDGDLAARVRFGHSAAIELVPGRHTVLIKSRWFETNSVSVEVVSAQRSDLYGGIRPMPAGMGPLQQWRWVRDCMWLSERADAPAVEATPPSTRWQAFRRFMLVTSPAVVLAFTLAAAAQRDVARAVTAFVILIISVFGLVQDQRARRPRPEQPASRDDNG